MRWLFAITICFSSPYIFCESLIAQQESDCRLKDVLQKAETATREIKDRAEQIHRLSEIALVYGKSGDKNTARERILECLTMAGTIADQTIQWHLQIAIFAAQVGYGDSIEANRNVEKYVPDGLKSSMRLLIVDEITLTDNNLQEATEIAKTISSKHERDRSYAGISYAWAQQGNLEAAFNYAKKIEDESGKSNAYLLIAQTLLEKGKPELAKKTVKRILRPRTKLGALRNIASAQLRAGKKKDALKTIEEARQFVDNPSDKISLILLEVEAGDGNIEKAVELAKTIPDKEDRSFKFGSIVLTLTKIKGAQHAFRFLKSRNIPISTIRKSGHYLEEIALAETKRNNSLAGMKIVELIDPNSYEYIFAIKKIAIYEAEQERFENALKIIAKIEDSYQKSEGLKEISLRQYHKEKKIDARRTLLLAIQSAKGVEIGGGTDVILLTELAIAQVKIQNFKNATTTFRLAIQKAKNYPENSYRGQMIGNVLEAQTKAMGKTITLKQALAYQSPVIRSQALIGVAKGMLDREKKPQHRN